MPTAFALSREQDYLTIGTNDVSIEAGRLLEQTLKDARIRADFVYLEGAVTTKSGTTAPTQRRGVS